MKITCTKLPTRASGRARGASQLALLTLLGLVPGLGLSKGIIKGEDTFELKYGYKLPPLAKGDKVVAWIPLAATDAFQKIERKVASHGLKLSESKDPEFANAVLSATPTSDGAAPSIEVIYRVTRREKEIYPAGPEAKNEIYLRSEPLVPLTERFKTIATEVTRGKSSAMDKGRALFEYVLGEMKYDKSGTGWGRGDAVYACDSKTGNCTDFHALFIALARSAGIPARFAIGFDVPAQMDEGKIEGYHCWAEFLAEGQWVPVDISEAAKEPELKAYYFGHHPANRLQLSAGRHLRVTPAPASGPLNFLAHPFVELNDKPVKGTVGTYTFKRLRSPGQKT